MATSSITKSFVIKDDKACDKLIKALSDTTPKKVVSTNYYEEGKKKLAQYFGHLDLEEMEHREFFLK